MRQQTATDGRIRRSEKRCDNATIRAAHGRPGDSPRRRSPPNEEKSTNDHRPPNRAPLAGREPARTSCRAANPKGPPSARGEMRPRLREISAEASSCCCARRLDEPRMENRRHAGLLEMSSHGGRSFDLRRNQIQTIRSTVVEVVMGFRYLLKPENNC